MADFGRDWENSPDFAPIPILPGFRDLPASPIPIWPGWGVSGFIWPPEGLYHLEYRAKGATAVEPGGTKPYSNPG